MTTFPDFSTAPLRGDAPRDTASLDDSRSGPADAELWETPERIDVKRVFTKADRDAVEAGTATTDDDDAVTPFPLDTVPGAIPYRSEEHTSELQSRFDLVCRLLLEKKKKNNNKTYIRNN